MYFGNIHLKSFLVIATLVHTNGTLLNEGIVNDLAKVLVSSADHKVEQKAGFNLQESRNIPLLMAFVKPFLNDPHGKSFLTEVDYTDITLFLMQRMFRSVLKISHELSFWLTQYSQRITTDLTN